jgi:hypothetical protein
MRAVTSCSQLEWVQSKPLNEEQLEGKSGFLLLVSQLLNERTTLFILFGRKLELSTNCTLVNCGKLLKPYLPRLIGNYECSRMGNAIRMVITIRMKLTSPSADEMDNPQPSLS